MLQATPVWLDSSLVPSCHAATIVQLASGHCLAAWFGGTHEGHPDVAIWMSRYDGTRWNTPVRLIAAPGVALWNPVLFRDAHGVIWLFYKAGPSVPAWTGLYFQSRDDGLTWTAPTLLPAGLLGPAKNKPIALSNGDILCGASAESWRNWAAWVEISADGGRSWSKHGPIVAPAESQSRGDPVWSPDLLGAGARPAPTDDPALVSATWDATTGQLRLPQEHRGVIQPTIWEWAPGRVRMLLRATQAVGAVCLTESSDYARTWMPARPLAIPHSNSGLDAVRLTDGRIVLACNPVHQGRSPLALLVSWDNGETWPWRRDLESGPGEYSYPSIIQAADGRVHVVYTFRRTHIQHVTLDSDDLG